MSPRNLSTLDFGIVAVSQPCIMIRMSLNVKSQGTKNLVFLPKGQTSAKNLRGETLYIANYE